MLLLLALLVFFFFLFALHILVSNVLPLALYFPSTTNLKAAHRILMNVPLCYFDPISIEIYYRSHYKKQVQHVSTLFPYALPPPIVVSQAFLTSRTQRRL